MLKNKLSTKSELDTYTKKLVNLRSLPPALKDTLERTPANSHPMDVMRRGCSMAGNLEPANGFENEQNVADRLVAIFRTIRCYWYHYFHRGK